MTRSHRARSTTLPRVAAAAAAVLVTGFAAPPAAAQTAVQVDPVSAPSLRSDAPRRMGLNLPEMITAPHAVPEQSPEVAEAIELLERAEAERAAKVAAEKKAEAERIEKFFFLAAVHDAEQRAAAERAEAERAERARAEAEAARAARSRSGGGLGGGFAALRRCESGGNYGAVNPSGTYRGAYQFSRSTWNATAARSFPHLVGVDPAAASPADQDAMAQALYRSSGSSPWPHCGRHL